MISIFLGFFFFPFWRRVCVLGLLSFTGVVAAANFSAGRGEEMRKTEEPSSKRISEVPSWL